MSRRAFVLTGAGTLFLGLVAGVASKFAIGPTWKNKYQVDWDDSVGRKVSDIPYGDGEANKLDLYLPETRRARATGLWSTCTREALPRVTRPTTRRCSSSSVPRVMWRVGSTTRSLGMSTPRRACDPSRWRCAMRCPSRSSARPTLATRSTRWPCQLRPGQGRGRCCGPAWDYGRSYSHPRGGRVRRVPREGAGRLRSRLGWPGVGAHYHGVWREGQGCAVSLVSSTGRGIDRSRGRPRVLCPAALRARPAGRRRPLWAVHGSSRGYLDTYLPVG